MKQNWKEPAEIFCRQNGATEIVHQNKRHLYDLKDFEDDVVVGLFDDDGFLITRIGDLTRDWGLGYFPSGIKIFDNYLSRKQFEKMNTEAKG